MKHLFVLFFAFLVISVRAGENPWMEVPLSAKAPEMTGKLSDPLWQGAPAFRLDANVASAPAKRAAALTMPTTFRVIRTDQALYFGFECTNLDSPDLKTRKRGRDQSVYEDEGIEIFLDVNNRSDYFHLIVNASGSLYDGRMMNSSWDGDWETATNITNGKWTAEVRIPFATIGGPPAEGAYWLLNIGRNAHGQGSKSETSAWASAGFHRPVGFLAFGPIDPRPEFENLAKELRGIANMEPYLQSAGRKEFDSIRAEFQELRGSNPAPLACPAYIKLLEQCERLSGRLPAVQTEGLCRMILDGDEGLNHPLARLQPNGTFVAPSWRMQPGNPDFFSLTVQKTTPAEDSPEDRVVCTLTFAAIEYISPVRLDQFQRVFQIIDTENNARYELCHGYTRKQPERVGIWVARRIKSHADGVLLDLLNRTGPATGMSIDVSPDGSSAGIGISSRFTEPGDSFRLGDATSAYPSLPLDREDDKKERFLIAPRTPFFSNSDPVKGFLLIPFKMDALEIISSVGHDRTTSTAVYLQTASAFSFYFAPGAGSTPAEVAPDPNWVATALELTLSGNIDPPIRRGQRRTEELLKLAKREETAIIQPGIAKLQQHYEQAMDQFAAIRRRAESFSGEDALNGWIQLAAAVQEVGRTQSELEQALALVVVPPHSAADARKSP